MGQTKKIQEKKNKDDENNTHFETHMSEIPQIIVVESMGNADFETHRREYCVRGFDLQDCYKTLKKVREDFKNDKES